MTHAPVPTVNSIPLALSRESGDAWPDAGFAQTDVVGGLRVFPISILSRGGDRGTAPSAQCAAQKSAKAACFQPCRPAHICGPLSACTRHSERLGDCQTGDGYRLASLWVPIVLALEVALSRRQ